MHITWGFRDSRDLDSKFLYIRQIKDKLSFTPLCNNLKTLFKVTKISDSEYAHRKYFAGLGEFYCQQIKPSL